MTYVCQYKRGRRLSIGAVGVFTSAEARDKAREILGDVAKGIDPTQDKGWHKGLTLREFIENEYNPWFNAHRKSGKKF
jgi:hypothetical protein